MGGLDLRFDFEGSVHLYLPVVVLWDRGFDTG